MSPHYLVLDAVHAADGSLKILNVQGGAGLGLEGIEAAYGRKGAQNRLRRYLQRLAELADGKRILFLQDSFTGGRTFPDDFFELVQRHIGYCPITDWVPDIQPAARRDNLGAPIPSVEQIGAFVDPLARWLRLPVGYCTGVRVEMRSNGETQAAPRPVLLLSGYRERVRRSESTQVLPDDEVGVLVFIGRSERLPDDLRRQSWLSLVNPPLLDTLLESRWLLPLLLEGTPAARLLPRSIPVGMGMRTAAEVREFAGALGTPNGFPLTVLRPSHVSLSPGVRFLDRTAVRALAARQPERRLPPELGCELLEPRVAHSYDEVSAYRGKLLDNLLRTRGAEVQDHGDGSFHYTAPYPFLETTVSMLQEFVEARPIRSRRTGKLHQGSVRVVLFDRKIIAAIHRLDAEPEDGAFRDLARPDAQLFYEGASPDDEEALQAELTPLAEEIDRQLQARIRTGEDLNSLRRQWLDRQLAA